MKTFKSFIKQATTKAIVGNHDQHVKFSDGSSVTLSAKHALNVAEYLSANPAFKPKNGKDLWNHMIKTDSRLKTLAYDLGKALTYNF